MDSRIYIGEKFSRKKIKASPLWFENFREWLQEIWNLNPKSFCINLKKLKNLMNDNYSKANDSSFMKVKIIFKNLIIIAIQKKFKHNIKKIKNFLLKIIWFAICA
jgi:hypothetical protein